MRALVATLGAVGLAALIVPLAAADIALLDNGTRVSGQLTSASGRLQFLPSDKPLASSPHLIQFSPTVADHAHAPQRLWLSEDQHVSGSLIEITAKEVVFQRGVKEKCTIRRSEVRAVSHAAPYADVFRDDFEQESKLWKRTGGAARSKEQAASGEWSLKLDRARQSAERTLPEPMAAGRIDVALRLQDAPGNAAWQMRLVCGEGAAETTVRVLLAGAARDGENVADAVPTRPGWHRLSIRLHPTYLLVGLDRQLVWSSADSQRFGPLRKIAFTCVGTEEASGAVYIDDVSVRRSAMAFHPSPGSVAGDVLRLASGDQLFGALAKAGPKSLDFRGKFTTAPFSWQDIAGIDLRAADVPTHRTVGEHVHVRFFGADGSVPDELLGVVAALNEDALTLEHAVLGKLVIERKRLVSLRPLFHGTRLELGHELRHLGPAGTKVPGLPAAAEGTSLKHAFKLDAAPRDATLVLSVAYPPGDRDSTRSDILMNGAKVERIERHVRRTSGEFRQIRIPLPADSFRAGDNGFEIRLSSAAEGGRTGHCLIRNVVLELGK